MEITIDQVRDLIKAEKVKPSDLFGAEDLTGDPTVKGFVEAEKRTAVAGEYAHRKRTEEGFDKTKADLEKKVQDAEAKAKTMEREVAKGKVPGLFVKERDARKLTDLQVKFIESRLPQFVPENPENVDKDFAKHLDKEIDECAKYGGVFGVEVAKAVDAEGKGSPAAGPEKNKPSLGKDAMLDPTRNPMIKIA